MMKIILIFAILTVTFTITLADSKDLLSTKDPFVEEAGDINISLPPFFEVYKGSNHSGYRITGLSTMKRQHNFGFGSLNFDFHVELERVTAIGQEYNIAGWVNATPLRTETAPSGEFEGSGEKFKFNMKEFVIDGNAEAVLKHGNRVSIHKLEIHELKFGSLSADLGDEFYVNDTSIDWEEFNKNFKTNFDQDFEDQKEVLVEKIRLMINNFVEKYTLTELIAAGGEGDVVKNFMSILPRGETDRSKNRKSKGKKTSRRGKSSLLGLV